MRSHGYGSEIIDKLVDFYGPSRSMVLEVERLDEPNDNPEQRAARWDFYKRNGFKTSNAFLEYEGLSFEILYRGDHFDENAYRDIFHKSSGKCLFDLSINIVAWAIYKQFIQTGLSRPVFHLFLTFANRFQNILPSYAIMEVLWRK